MELDKEKDLFLLNIEPIIGKNLIKICDENIYVDNNGAPLRVIQWFYFQLVLLVGIYLELDGPKIDNKGKIDNTFNSNGTKLDFLIYKKDDNKYDYAKDENGSRIIIDKETGIPLDKIGLRNFIFNLSLNHGRTSKMLWDKLRDKVLKKGTKSESEKKFKKYGLINYEHYPLGYTKFKLRLNDTKDDVIGWDYIEDEIIEQEVKTIIMIFEDIFKEIKKISMTRPENIIGKQARNELIYLCFKILLDDNEFISRVKGHANILMDMDMKSRDSIYDIQYTNLSDNIKTQINLGDYLPIEDFNLVLKNLEYTKTNHNEKEAVIIITYKKMDNKKKNNDIPEKLYINLNNERIKEYLSKIDCKKIENKEDHYLCIHLDVLKIELLSLSEIEGKVYISSPKEDS